MIDPGASKSLLLIESVIFGSSLTIFLLKQQFGCFSACFKQVRIRQARQTTPSKTGNAKQDGLRQATQATPTPSKIGNTKQGRQDQARQTSSRKTGNTKQDKQQLAILATPSKRGNTKQDKQRQARQKTASKTYIAVFQHTRSSFFPTLLTLAWSFVLRLRSWRFCL